MSKTTKSEPTTPPRWRFWLSRIAVAILVPLLLLALTEGALWVFHVGYSTDLMEPCMVHGQPASCYNLFFPAPFFPPGMIKTPQFFSIPAQKSPNTYRIVVLGESAAMGDPDSAYGFSRYLEVMLRTRFPNINFEVVNTGMVAINSHVSRLIARQLVPYQPDLFIVYAGSNEVVGPYGPGTVLTASSMNIPVIRTSLFVRSTRIGQYLTSAGAARAQWRGMEMFLDRRVAADSPLMTRAYANFESNLRDIVDAGQNARARVLLSTIATNLRDCPPFGSSHRSNLSQDARRTWDSLVQQGIGQETAGEYQEALKLYDSAAQIDDRYAELQFRIAHSHLALGNTQDATLHYSLARDLDSLRFRADSHINEVIRSVAKSSGSGTELLDTETLFASESHSGITSSELLYDHVHFTPTGNYILARAAFIRVARGIANNALGGTASLEPLSQTDCERLLALTGHDRSRIAGEMADRLQHPPFTTQLNHAEQLQSFLFHAGRSTESIQDTVAQYQFALAQAPNDRILHHKFGLFLFNYNPNVATQELLLGRPTDDFPIFMPDGTPIQ